MVEPDALLHSVAGLLAPQREELVMPGDHSGGSRRSTQTKPAAQPAGDPEAPGGATETHTTQGHAMTEPTGSQIAANVPISLRVEVGVFDDERQLLAAFPTRERALGFARLQHRVHPDRPVYLGRVEHRMIITGVVEVGDLP